MMTIGASRAQARAFGTVSVSWMLWTVVFVAVAPNIVWIALDKTAWPWDQAWYGKHSVDLFFTLIYAPSEWLPAMLSAFGRQAPGIAWVGQFFVPVGVLTGSIDTGLLLSIVCAQGLAIFLTARALGDLARGKPAISALGLIVMAAAPLSIALSHYYLVEMMQMTAVAWFIFIMARAPSWDRPLIMGQLALATAFAMLAKVSSPLFCFGPGLVALYYIVRAGKPDHVAGRASLITLAVALPVGLATVAWYHRNLAAVIAHVSMAASGPVAELYGKSEQLLPSLRFWVSAVGTNFLSSLTSVVAVAAVSAGILAALITRDLSQRRLLIAAAVAALQIAATLAIFSLNSNRDERYLLPLLPYVAVVLGWSVAQVNRRLATSVVIAAFVLQWAHAHAESLGFLAKSERSPRWLNAVMTNPRDRAILDSLVQRTCAETGSGFYWNAIGVQLLWLNPPGVSYAATKKFAPHRQLTCDYDAIAYFDSDEALAWNRLMSRHITYYIALDSTAYALPSTEVDRTVNQLNEPILDRIEASGLFQLEPGIAEHHGIMVFKRVDRVNHVAQGRALSDRGKHTQAVEELQRATGLEPANVEAWANLAVAYERQGDMRSAIAAGTEARRLQPTHYYVNLGLARALSQQKRWAEAMSRAEDAAAHAPGVSERVTALALAARSAFEADQRAQGCTILRTAADLQASREIQADLKRYACAPSTIQR
jgi:hypothetical protein